MTRHRRLYFLLSFTFFIGSANANSRSLFADTSHPRELTIAYGISVQQEGKAKVGETYNGGLKTIFVSGERARIRQASLARIQSVFLLPGQTAGSHRITIVKESGAEKYRVNMTAQQWAAYNKKYDSAVFTPHEDSLIIASYQCRRATVTLTDGRKIEVFYTTQLSNTIFQQADPAFREAAPPVSAEKPDPHVRDRLAGIDVAASFC